MTIKEFLILLSFSIFFGFLFYGVTQSLWAGFAVGIGSLFFETSCLNYLNHGKFQPWLEKS
jgi:hypothetical protein